ncbi:MAG: hypothetical protein K8S54_18505 [Spirochaetia bacterium]|nr:hypothetical protein [Spirochaetia bacterium]
MAGEKKRYMSIGVVPAADSGIFKVSGPFRMILEQTDRPGVKRLKKVIKEEPETVGEFHDFIRYLTSQIRRAADLLYQVGDERHKKRAETLRNHAFRELEVAQRYETDPGRLRASMARLQQALRDMKEVADEEEVEGH